MVAFAGTFFLNAQQQIKPQEQTHVPLAFRSKEEDVRAIFQASPHCLGRLSGEAGNSTRESVAAKLMLDESWWPEKFVTGETATAELFALSEAQSIKLLLGWKSAVPIYKAVRLRHGEQLALVQAVRPDASTSCRC